MGMVKRQGDAQLLIALRSQGRALTQAKNEHSFNSRSIANLGELRTHVGVFGAIGFISYQGDTVLSGYRFGFLATGLAKATGLG